MDAEMDLKKGIMCSTWLSCHSLLTIQRRKLSLAALEKIRSDFVLKDAQKLSDHSSESNDESHYEDNDERRKGAKKKRLLSVPKRDQLIQTVYTGYDNFPYEVPQLLEAGGV